MNPSDVIHSLLPHKKNPSKEQGAAFAPSNIALAKYWGKRNAAINLPVTSSLSISLRDKGTHTTVSQSATNQDIFILNAQPVINENRFSSRLTKYLDLFRPSTNFFFKVETNNTIPMAAGLASSASGFAALALSLNDFFDWHLNDRDLSILARLGSGSAARSLWHGFVEWHVGSALDGMDCFAEKLPYQWPDFRIGLLVISEKEKMLSSREAMQRSQQTSPFYKEWPAQVDSTIKQLHQAIQDQNIHLLGQAAEQNALAMHATMFTSNPPYSYWQAETLSLMQQIWQLRANDNMPLYFTEDAGPNLKLLFTREIEDRVMKEFPGVEVVVPFYRAP